MGAVMQEACFVYLILCILL